MFFEITQKLVGNGHSKAFESKNWTQKGVLFYRRRAQTALIIILYQKNVEKTLLRNHKRHQGFSRRETK
jgi:hypothetical protein